MGLRNASLPVVILYELRLVFEAPIFSETPWGFGNSFCYDCFAARLDQSLSKDYLFVSFFLGLLVFVCLFAVSEPWLFLGVALVIFVDGGLIIVVLLLRFESVSLPRVFLSRGALVELL